MAPTQYSPVGNNNCSNEVEHQFQTLYRPAPFTDEYEAQLARDRTDYSIKFTIEMAKSGKASRPVRIYADGIYDVFHQGHARQLMQAKNLFPNVYLIVGVCSDELTHARKGCTVMTDSERYEAVRHCRYVDEVLRDAPWVTDMEFLTRNKIDFVAHDEEPYTTGTEDDCYAYLKEKGMFVPTVRTDGISTSDIVARIVKDYDVYVRRNLARGYSAKDLNVGFIKEKTFKLQNKMDSLRETGKRVLDNLDERRSDIIHKWEDKSREFIHSFLLLFGKEGRMSQMWNESRGKILKALSPPGSPSRDLHENSSSEEDDDSESEIEPKRRRVQKTSDYSDDEDLLEYDSEINSRKSTKIAK